MPVLKDMEDDNMPEFDESAADYNEAAVAGYLAEQGDLWCDDLCVTIIKQKEKEMTLIDLYANMSWHPACGASLDAPTRSCTAAEIAEEVKSIEIEEAYEQSYCAQIVRPAADEGSEPDVQWLVYSLHACACRWL